MAQQEAGLGVVRVGLSMLGVATVDSEQANIPNNTTNNGTVSDNRLNTRNPLPGIRLGILVTLHPNRIWVPKLKPKRNLHRHRIGQRCQHRHSGVRRNAGNIAICTFLDTGLRRCDKGFGSLRSRKLTHCRLPKQTLEFS